MRSGLASRGCSVGERVGIPWLGHTCGVCPYCMGGQENLCDHPLFTGYTRDGGFATATIADARFAFPLGEAGTDVALAPLLCAGLIGWRSLVIAGDGKKLGLYGFGAAAHIVAQIAKWQGRSVFAFTRPGDVATQAFARQPGRDLGGRIDEMPPEPLDAAIIFATVGDLVPLALKAVRKGGRVVCAGIHMSDIPSFPIACSGRSGSSSRSPISRGRMESISCAWRRRSASSPRPRLSAQPGQPSPCRSPRRPFDGAAVLVP